MPSGARTRALRSRQGVTVAGAISSAPAAVRRSAVRSGVLDPEREANRPGHAPADLDAVDQLGLGGSRELERARARPPGSRRSRSARPTRSARAGRARPGRSRQPARSPRRSARPAARAPGSAAVAPLAAKRANGSSAPARDDVLDRERPRRRGAPASPRRRARARSRPRPPLLRGGEDDPRRRRPAPRRPGTSGTARSWRRRVAPVRSAPGRVPDRRDLGVRGRVGVPHASC